MKMKNNKKAIALNLTIMVVSVVFAIGMGEWFFRVLDPDGIFDRDYAYFILGNGYRPDEIGYATNAGIYNTRHFTATILDDSSRAVPDSNLNSECHVAIIGDSFAWGMGVSDEDTYANRIAQATDYRVSNYGFSAFNAEQVLAVRNRYDADVYVWLHILNDWHLPIFYTQEQLNSRPLFKSALWSRLNIQVNIDEDDVANDNIAYRNALESLVTDPQVITFAFDEAIGTRAHEWHPSIILLDDAIYVNNPVSRADAHPNAIGHQQIADGMLPHVEQYVNEVCN